MVEFALAFTLLCIVVLSAIDMGRAFFTWNQVKNAAREGAAYAERDPWSQSPGAAGCANPDNIVYRARTENGAVRPELTVTTKRTKALPPSTAEYSGCQTPGSFDIAPGDKIRVEVSTPFNPISPFAGAIFGTPTIRADVEVVVQ